MTTEVKIREEKVAVVKEITDVVNSSQLVVISDYSGLGANEMNELRSQLRESGAQSKIYKNTFMRRALDGLGISYPAELLQGPTICISAEEDVVAASKVLTQFAKKNEALEIKGGVMQEATVDKSAIDELAKLPSREELIAKVVGLIKAPLTALVGNLSSPVRGLAGVLNSIKTKKEDGGE